MALALLGGIVAACLSATITVALVRVFTPVPVPARAVVAPLGPNYGVPSYVIANGGQASNGELVITAQGPSSGTFVTYAPGEPAH
jgi:hypothetical protein